MNIQILNNDLSLFGIAAGFESVEFTRAFNSKGYFKLKINANNQNAKYVKIDKIVYLDADKIGYIDKVTFDRKSSKADEYIIAEGVELKDRLGRLIYPPSEQESDSYTNEYLETIVKSLIEKNAGSLASADRQIPNLTTTADQYRGDLIDYSARFKDLSTEIYSLLSSQNMGLKATVDLEDDEIVFDVAQGSDLTANENASGGIVLSLGTKTALEITDVDDRLSYKNLSVTSGLLSGNTREVLEVGTSSSGYARREVFTEARDIESSDEMETRGLQKLSEISKTRGISVKANSFGSYQIGDDYDLGDFISVDANGEIYSSQVIKIKEKHAKNDVPDIDIVLNFDVDDSLLTNIQAKHMSYDALLAAGTNGYLPLSGGTLTGDLDVEGDISQDGVNLDDKYLSSDYLQNRSISDADTVDNTGITGHFLPSDASHTPDGTGGYALFSLNYSNKWSSQLAGDWHENDWYVRSQNNGTWGSWDRLLRENDMIHVPSSSNGNTYSSYPVGISYGYISSSNKSQSSGEDFPAYGTLLTINYASSRCFQIFVSTAGTMKTRVYYSPTWTSWA